MVLFILGVLLFFACIILLIYNRRKYEYEFIPPIVFSIWTYETIWFYNYGYSLFIPAASQTIMFISSVTILVSLTSHLLFGNYKKNLFTFAYIVTYFFEITFFVSIFSNLDLTWLLIAQKITNYIIPVSALMASFYLFFYLGRQFQRKRIVYQNARENILEIGNFEKQATLWVPSAAIIRFQDVSKELILRIIGSVYIYLNSDYPKRHFTDKYYIGTDPEFLKLFQGLSETTVQLLIDRLRYSDLYMLSNRIDLEKFQQFLVPELFSQTTDSSSSILERLLEDLPSQIFDRIRRDSNKDSDGMQQTKLFQSQIRELIHSFVTPLNTIDRAIKLINMDRDNIDFEKVLDENIPVITNSISLSYSLLYAYRGLALLDFPSSNRVFNIKVMLSDIIKSLSDQHNKTIIPQIVGEDFSFDGYSNEIVIAIILPLLQNAIEASENNDEISIEEYSIGNLHNLVISNSFHYSLTLDQVSLDGFSTKIEGSTFHSGLGLPSVRHIARELGIVFSTEIKDHLFIATLKFSRNNKKAG